MYMIREIGRTNHERRYSLHCGNEHVAHLQDDREFGNGCAEALGQRVANRA